jgi:hypothetical protein
MSPTETAKVCALIAARCPQQRFEPGTTEAWYSDLQAVAFHGRGCGGEALHGCPPVRVTFRVAGDGAGDRQRAGERGVDPRT